MAWLRVLSDLMSALIQLLNVSYVSATGLRPFAQAAENCARDEAGESASSVATGTRLSIRRNTRIRNSATQQNG